MHFFLQPHGTCPQRRDGLFMLRCHFLSVLKHNTLVREMTFLQALRKSLAIPLYRGRLKGFGQVVRML